MDTASTLHCTSPTLVTMLTVMLVTMAFLGLASVEVVALDGNVWLGGWVSEGCP